MRLKERWDMILRLTLEKLGENVFDWILADDRVVVTGELYPDILLRLFVGISSGWSMDGGGGLDKVDAEEDPGDFENKRRSPYFELSVGLFECRRIYWYIFGGKN